MSSLQEYLDKTGDSLTGDASQTSGNSGAGKTRFQQYLERNNLTIKAPELPKTMTFSTPLLMTMDKSQKQYLPGLDPTADTLGSPSSIASGMDVILQPMQQLQNTLVSFDKYGASAFADEGNYQAFLDDAESVRKIIQDGKVTYKDDQYMMMLLTGVESDLDNMINYADYHRYRMIASGKVNAGNEAYEKAQNGEDPEGNMWVYYSSLPYRNDFESKSQYVSTANGKSPDWRDALLGRYEAEDSGYDDPVYEYVNGNADAGAYLELMAGSGHEGLGYIFSVVVNSRKEIEEMSETEVAIFNFLYSTKGADAAYKFLEGITGSLYERQRLKNEAEWAEYARKDPVGSSIATVLMSPLKGLSYIGQTADYFADGEINPNKTYNYFSYTSSAARNEVSDMIANSGKWGAVGSFAYQVGMSMGDFLMSTAVSGGNQTFALLIMGTGAAADATLEAKSRGLRDDQAFALGTIAGLTEAAMEKIGLDALFGKGASKSAIKYILNNMLAEGLEEAGTDIINTLADILISQDKSQWQKAIDAYKANGKTETEAFWRAVLDKGAELGLSFAGGALSGGIMSSVGAGVSNIVLDTKLNHLDADAVVSMIDEGLANDAGSESYRIAKELADKVENGEKITVKDLRMLLNANDAAYRQKVESMAKNMGAEDIQALVESGLESDPNSESYQLAQALQQKLNKGQKISTSELVELIMANDAAIRSQWQEVAAAVEEAENGNQQTGLDAAPLSLLRAEPTAVTNAALTVIKGESVSNSMADKILADSGAVAYLQQQVGMKLTGTASAQRSAVKMAVSQLVRQKMAPAASETAKPQQPQTGGVSVGGAVINQENTGGGSSYGQSAANPGVLSGGPGGKSGSGTGGSVGRMAGRTGGTYAGNEQRAAASRRQSAVNAQGLPAVSTASLGITNGSNQETVRVVPEALWDDAMQETAQSVREKTGKDVTYVIGGLLVDKGNGLIRANGAYTAGGIIIQADNLRFTVEQIANHEVFHDMAFRTPWLVKQVESDIREKFDSAELDAVIDAYSERLALVPEGATEAQIEAAARQVVEEVMADAYAGVNRFSADAAQFQEVVQQRVAADVAPVAGGPENGVRQTNGPPDVRYSVEADDLQAKNMTTPESGVKYQTGKNGSMDNAEIQAVQSIGRKSVNEFTVTDMKKSEGLARRYWSEMREKSPFFRAWFGDWRINDQTPVNIANEVGDTRGVQKNDDTGWDIQVSGKVFAESKHFASKNTSALPYLPYINDIIKKAVLLNSFGESKRKSVNSLLMHSLYAIADIGNGPEILKLYVEEINNPNASSTLKRAYQLQNIEKASVVNGGVQSDAPSSLSSATNAVRTVADLFATVKSKDASFNPKPASKIVNADGTPMVVYHGTSDRFTQFKDSEIAPREGSFFFAQNREDAEAYTGNGTIMEVYVNLQNPIDYNDMPSEIYRLKDKKAQVEALKKLGYDGWYCDMDTGWGEVSAFYPEQIKSATDNTGAFDGTNPDIRFMADDDVDVEGKQEQVGTRQFKRWFGDWQNNPQKASKVVDGEGMPMVMYHGTSNYGFTVFNTYGGRFGLFGKGSYFTSDPAVAETYTKKGKGNSPGVYSVYLNIRNPMNMDLEADVDSWRSAFEQAGLDASYLDGIRTNEDAFNALKENLADEEYARWEAEDIIVEMIEGMGYDGISHIGGGRVNQADINRHQVYIAFHSEQIKSATDNVGTFDGENPDIRFMADEVDVDEDARQRVAQLEQVPEYRPGMNTDKGGAATGESIETIVANAEQRALQAKAELMRNIPKARFKGTDAMEKLGIKVDNSVGDYSMVKAMIANDQNAKGLIRELRRAETRLQATAAEKNYASGIAAGYYSPTEIPASMDADTVMELADYIWAVKGITSDLIQQRRGEIKQALYHKMERLMLKVDAKKIKLPKSFALHHRSAVRNMTTIFGTEIGEQINDFLFHPVAANEAERYRFINRMHDEVRTFEGKDGKKKKLNKQERALVQQVIEGRAVEETVAGMEMRHAIKNAAENIRNGSDAGDAQREFSLNSEERELAIKYSRWLQTQEALNSENVDTLRVDNAVKKYSELFDRFHEAINDFLVAHGYEPIGYIKGYAPHMQPEANHSALRKVLEKLGVPPEVSTLPTSIAGLTKDFKPSKRWNPYFLSRRGDVTDFDIAKAFESYVDYMSDVIYHTDDIMRVRQAVEYFRKTYAPEQNHDLIDQALDLRYATVEEKLAFLRANDQIDLMSFPSAKEIDAALDEYINTLFGNLGDRTVYSDFVMWLDDYANKLAGKQLAADREQERTLGRTSLNWVSKLNRVFTRAQVAGNLSSALNQTAQLPQIIGENGIRYTAMALADMTSFKLRKSGWYLDSDFLTEKRGIDYIVNSTEEMIISGMFKPLEIVDSAMSTLAVRGRYLKEIKAGKSHAEAMKIADRFGRSIMGSRAKGSIPLAFQQKGIVAQFFHTFQVEAANSWEHIVVDLPQDFHRIQAEKGVAAAIAALAGVIVKTLLSAFLLNRAAEEVYGGTPAPYDLLGLTANFIASGQELTTNQYLLTVMDNCMESITGQRVFGTEDSEKLHDGRFDWQSAISDTWYNISNDIPYLRNAFALLGWGDDTLPMPDVVGLGKDIYNAATDENAGLFSPEMGQALVGLAGDVLPGGRQLEKTVAGVETAIRGGKYKGYGENQKLVYPVDVDPWKALQLALFGDAGATERNEYYASGNKALTANQTDVYDALVAGGADAQMVYDAIQDYREVTNDSSMDSLERGVRSREIISNMNMTDDQKLEMYRVLTGADGTADKFQVLLDEGMSWNAIMDVYNEYATLYDSDDLSAENKATKFSKWLDGQGYTDAQKAVIKEQFKFWRMFPAQASEYESFVQSGLEPDEAYGLVQELGELEPLEGAGLGSALQQWRVCVDFSSNVDVQMAALAGKMTDSQFAKVQIAYDFSVSPDTYITFRENLFDVTGGGSYNQSDVEKVIRRMRGLSTKEKAVLWQLAVSSTSAKNNPFSVSYGEKVLKAKQKASDTN